MAAWAGTVTEQPAGPAKPDLNPEASDSRDGGAERDDRPGLQGIQPMVIGEVRAERLMRWIEPRVRETLTPEQVAAIRKAAEHNPWQGHPIDIRFTLPLLFGRYYVTLVAGRERRSNARLATERQAHPLILPGNVLFIAGATVVSVLAGMAAIAALVLAFGILAL